MEKTFELPLEGEADICQVRWGDFLGVSKAQGWKKKLTGGAKERAGKAGQKPGETGFVNQATTCFYLVQ